MDKTLASIGEFGLIDRIHELIRIKGAQNPDVVVGIGDDAACTRPRQGYETVVTCDAMVEGRHYLPAHISYPDLGRRAMAMNISDIGAMGGRPLFALVSLGLRPELLVDDIESLYEGFMAELNPFGAQIVGGNITRSDGNTFIDITLIGEVEAGKAVRRSTGRPGDAILVTGYPGQAAAGLHLLLGHLPESGEAEPAVGRLLNAYRRPSHRAREGRSAALAGCVSAMIDISDGLLGDLGHICTESRAGALLFQDRLPLSKELREIASRLGIDPFEFVFGDSDDYELIITCSPADVDRVRSAVAEVAGPPVTEIGRLEQGEGIRIRNGDGTERVLKPKGWDHFGPDIR